MALSAIANLVNSLECCVYSVSSISLAEQTGCLSPLNYSVFLLNIKWNYTILSELGLPEHYGQTSGELNLRLQLSIQCSSYVSNSNEVCEQCVRCSKKILGLFLRTRIHLTRQYYKFCDVFRTDSDNSRVLITNTDSNNDVCFIVFRCTQQQQQN